METPAQDQYWQKIAQHWSRVGCPLRPGSNDAACFSELIAISRQAPLDVLVLGVTPELYHLDWPVGSRIRAADRSPEMIRAIWPGPAADAIEADWLDLPLDSGTFDFVLCDGGLHLLSYPDAQRRLARAIGRLLKPGGQFILRLFALPDEPETPAGVLSDLRSGTIHNTHVLKLRLAMALQPSPQRGIAVDDIYRTLVDSFDSLEGLCAATGWPRDEVFTLISYRNARNRYHFVTEQQCADVLTAGGVFESNGRFENHYPLGDRCPVVAFRKVATS